MLQSVSISSKNQVTIPQVFAKSLNIKRGQRFVVERVGDSLVFTSAEALVRHAAGLIKVKKPVSNRAFERMIDAAKAQQFNKNPFV